MSTLTRTEQVKLSALRDDIALGFRGSVEMDGPEVARLAYEEFMRRTRRICDCGCSDGDECHCRGDPPDGATP